MHTGIILLVWLALAVMLVVGLIVSGILSVDIDIKIEKIDSSDEKEKEEEENSD